MRTVAWTLATSTPPSWALAAAADPLALLADHAHCELGAAATAQGLIARNPNDRVLVERLSALAVDELRHFRQVHALLRRRGGELGHRDSNPYVAGLRRGAARIGHSSLLDRLLVAALIERRSHERFELLAEHAPEAELRALYASLLSSEEAHGHLFVDLALRRFTAEDVEPRLTSLIAIEARVLGELPFAACVHSGPGAPGPGGARVAGKAHGIAAGDR